MFSKRMLSKVYITGTLAGGLILAGGTAALASTTTAGTPVITVTPSTGIQSGSAVQVAGSGLVANDVYHVGECAQVGSQYACDPAVAVNVTSDGSGNLATPLTVVSTFTGTDANGNNYAVDCATSTCVVGVFDSSFNGGAVPISFSS